VAEPTAVLVPRENVNDDIVTLVRWHAASGERVRAGQLLFEIETAKTVYTIEAEREGYVEIVCPAGEEIAVGEVAARIHDAAFAAAPAPVAASSAAPGTAASGGQGAQVITKKARALIDEKGLDVAQFKHLAIVRESDVQQALEGGAQAGASHAQAGPSPSASSTAQSTAPRAAGGRNGALKDVFVSSRERGTNPFTLAMNYLFRNYLLGLLVRVAPRGVILVLHRMRGVKMGSGVFIDPTAIVETAYPENITIGDDVRIAAGSVIMTHLKAPHHLRETGLIPNLVKEVVLEDSCFIGINAVVMPGVRVGKASVVISGSVVFSDVPPYTMVQGNPAKVIKRFPRPDGAQG
jgi:acetyltransferase-like isoleucine patch superfamily enzyme